MTLCESSYDLAHQELAEDDDAQRQAAAIAQEGEERLVRIERPRVEREEL